MWSMHTTEYYSAIKSNEVWPFARIWNGTGGLMLSEINQVQKDKYRLISLICGMEKTVGLTGVESRLVFARGWETMGWGRWINGC